MKVSLSDLLQSVRIATVDTALVDIAHSGGARLLSKRNAFLHLVLDGEIMVHEGDTGEPVTLAKGDYVVSLGARAQILTAEANAKVTTSEYFCASHAQDAPPTIRFGVGPRAARILSGAFHLPVVNPLVRALPRQMIVRRGTDKDRGIVDFDIDALARSAVGLGATTLLTSMFDMLLMQAVRNAVTTLYHGGLQLQGVHNYRIPLALSLVHSQPERRWTLARLASEVGVSRSTFAAEFKDVVGEPLLSYLTRLRMNRAADMLRWQPVSVADAAWAVGYESVASFTRTFRQHFGTTPAAFQRTLAPRYADSVAGHMHWSPFLANAQG